jgi:hypothetical protein
MGAEPTRERWAMQGVWSRTLDDEGTNELSKRLFSQVVLQQCNHLVRPIDRVVEIGVMTVGAQEEAHCGKCRSLIALLKGMRSRHSVHQHHRKDDKTFLAVSEGIAWARQSAFEQADVSNEVVFAGIREFEPIMFDDSLYRNPDWFIRQGAL